MSTLRPCPKPTPKPKAERKRPQRKPIRQGPPKVRDRAYLDWIKAQPCLAQQKFFPLAGYAVPCGRWPSRHENEPAHIQTRGSGGADRGNTVPLCPLHHDEQEGDTDGFERVYGVNLKLEAARLLVRYIEAGEP
jgi:hypothetical protein